jgi:hypothetical protein
MKKFTLYFFLMLFTASIFAGTVKYTYTFSSPTVKEVGSFKVLTYDNCLLTGITGEPALPYQAVKLLLPAGEEAISVSYDFENENVLEGVFTIYPQQPSQPISVGSDGILHQDMNIYSSGNVYPSVAWGRYSTQFLNGHSFLLATFTPLNYIPASGKVSFFQKITITVETRVTERSSKALENLNSSPNVESRIKTLAQNPAMASTYPLRSTRDGEYQILIITPENFVSYYQQLTDLYLVRGFKTEIATTQNIQANSTGQDLQEKMRNYIIAEYQAHGIQYVILGGDDELLPHRGFYCIAHSSSDYEDSDIPADLYYSGLDGNWNSDGDGYWAEPDEDDLLPDISVARIPASTVSQLQKALHKSISYQDTPVLGELRNAIVAGEWMYDNPLTYGEDYLELLIGHHEDNGYTTDGIPENYNFNKMYDSQASWTGYDLINEINQGTGFVHHAGHANQTYVMRLNIEDITNSNFAQTNGIDHNYPLVYTHGCDCGAFDDNDCIGEAMVLIDNFAVAGAFNSRYGWFNEGQTEGPSAHLHREFVNALYHDHEYHVGAAHMISKIETSVWVEAPGQWEEGALRWCFYDCNILGDPVLGFWTDEPISIVTTYPEYIAPGTTSVPVTVTSNGEPVAGLNCVFMAEGVMLGCSPTDSDGQAIIEVPGGFDGLEAATLVVSGNNCLPQQYPVDITVGVGESLKEITTLSVQPNPFSDKTRLLLNLKDDRQVTISFYDLSGRLLEKSTLNGHEGQNELLVNASEWPDGLIQAKIVAGSQVIHSQLVHIRK